MLFFFYWRGDFFWSKGSFKGINVIGRKMEGVFFLFIFGCLGVKWRLGYCIFLNRLCCLFFGFFGLRNRVVSL